MNDVDWLEEERPPARRRGLPKWLMLGCGCGCLVVLALLAAVVFVVSRARSPERQWPLLREVLYFEEQPEDLEFTFGWTIPFTEVRQFQLMDAEPPMQIQIHAFGAMGPEALDPMFEEDPNNLPFNFTEPVEGELGELELQGRTVRALRYSTLGGFSAIEELGPGIRIDVSREGMGIAVQLHRLGSKDPLSDGEIRAFFEHFDLWRDG